ncbi:MAG: GntR family transcriptional regulator [Deltaproteobacteria bacterium]|nr:GntR family transcriptional regulator [Deltaproteobacteria bacterium]
MPEPEVKDLRFRPSVLVEQVSETLSEAIMEGVFKGGDQLVEEKLQKQLGISRSPLREAFRDLEKKGLVVIIPRKGTFVKTITRKDIEDNFPVRASLEGLAAREAYRRVGPRELDALAQALQDMRRAAEKKDAKAYMEHHMRFHEGYINASRNEVLIKILANLRMHSIWYRFSYQYYKEDFPRSLAVHEEILSLFRDTGAGEDKVERLVRRHIEEALERFLTYLEQQGRTHEKGPGGA